MTGKPNTVSIAALGAATNVNLQTYCWNGNEPVFDIKIFKSAVLS